MTTTTTTTRGSARPCRRRARGAHARAPRTASLERRSAGHPSTRQAADALAPRDRAFTVSCAASRPDRPGPLRALRSRAAPDHDQVRDDGGLRRRGHRSPAESRQQSKPTWRNQAASRACCSTSMSASRRAAVPGLRGVFVQRLGEFVEFGRLDHAAGDGQAGSSGSPGAGMVIGAVMAASPVARQRLRRRHRCQDRCASYPVPATLPIADMVDRLNALRPPALMGYPTKLAQLAREQLAGRLAIAPRSVTVTSEQLTARDRTTITAAFGVPVVNHSLRPRGWLARANRADRC